MNSTTQDKQYLGREEAFEWNMSHGFYRLPNKGRVNMYVPAIATGKIPEGLGHDEAGYFLTDKI